MKKSLIKLIREWANWKGIPVKITPLDPDDPPAPKTGMTGQQLADYFSPQATQKRRGGKHGN